MPEGEIGEIVATGPSVTKAYDQLPEATRLSKIIDGDKTWHRIGDLGYFDPEGLLWFCGRKVERVICGADMFYTDRCEGVFNTHARVFRSALIAVKGQPAIVVEPMPREYPKNGVERAVFVEELKALGKSAEVTERIDTFLFKDAFPVDVRHNAKIHRLTLAKEFDRS